MERKFAADQICFVFATKGCKLMFLVTKSDLHKLFVFTFGNMAMFLQGWERGLCLFWK